MKHQRLNKSRNRGFQKASYDWADYLLDRDERAFLDRRTYWEEDDEECEERSFDFQHLYDDLLERSTHRSQMRERELKYGSLRPEPERPQNEVS